MGGEVDSGVRGYSVLSCVVFFRFMVVSLQHMAELFPLGLFSYF